MEQDEKERIMQGVLKRAAGYESVETQEEYALVDGQMTLVKRKVCTKDVPPDLAAVKLLLDGDATPTVSYEELKQKRAELTEQFFALLREKEGQA